MHALETAHLLESLGHALLGHAGLFHLGAVLVHLHTVAVGLSELGLDGAQLLAQEVLPLSAGHLVLGLRLDLRLDRRHVELAADQRVHLAQPRQGILDLEHLLSLGHLQLQVGGDEVRQLTRIGHVGGDRYDLGREVH